MLEMLIAEHSIAWYLTQPDGARVVILELPTRPKNRTDVSAKLPQQFFDDIHRAMTRTLGYAEELKAIKDAIADCEDTTSIDLGKGYTCTCKCHKPIG